ncbi:ATP10 protein-domain-containing protein [Tricladium varicosporioides]|nr:ATP10 protein-domain-containing protein [Hymenoscyphus varicosporioides]
MIVARRPLRLAKPKYDISDCILCQWRSFSSSYQRPEEKLVKPSLPPASKAASAIPKTSTSPVLPESPLQDAPRAYGKAHSKFDPKPLNRPIGLPKPPQAGENTGIDKRAWKQRRDDFVNYDKHLERRKQLTHQVASPYFREWDNMRFHKGKSFLAPPGLFKGDRSLYFPNLHGQTLIKDKRLRDTTPVFEDKITVVSMFSTAWGENQAATFVSEKSNPELHEVVGASNGRAQMVQINVEPNFLKAMIIKFFMPNLRKKITPENWKRYFLIRKGLTEEVRDAIGMLNSKVGYTYLLDGQCKIRWAGSGISEGDEKHGLVRGVRRLIEDAKAKNKLAAISNTKPSPSTSPQPKKAIDLKA